MIPNIAIVYFLPGQILIRSDYFAGLCKDEELLGENADNELSFDSNIKICNEKLFNHSLCHLWNGTHLDNDNNVNFLFRKIKQPKLRIKGSFRPVPKHKFSCFITSLSNNK